jgi:hypothetical protein
MSKEEFNKTINVVASGVKLNEKRKRKMETNI